MTNTDLLALYKIEKEQMDMPLDPFPPFKEWKAEYMIEYNDSHSGSKMVKAEDAIADADRIVDEADAELAGEATKKPTPIVKPVAKKTTPKPVTKKPTAEKKPKSVSKKVQATEAYKDMIATDGTHPTRKDVISRFVECLGMSKAGASTYHHNIKKELT